MAKRKRPADFILTPADGGIRLEPNQTIVFGIDRLPQPPAEWHISWFSRLRGDVLSRSFPIYNELLLIILLAEFDRLDVISEDDDLLVKQALYRRETLGELIKRFAAASKWATHLPDDTPILSELYEVLRIRNLLAHQPFWLDPVIDPEAGTIPGAPKLRVIGYMPMIADEKSIWSVDSRQADEWTHLFARVTQTLAGLREKMNLQTAPIEASGFRGPASVFVPAGRPIPNPSARYFELRHAADGEDLPLVPGDAPAASKVERKTTQRAYQWIRIGSPAQQSLTLQYRASFTSTK